MTVPNTQCDADELATAWDTLVEAAIEDVGEDQFDDRLTAVATLLESSPDLDQACQLFCDLLVFWLEEDETDEEPVETETTEGYTNLLLMLGALVADTVGHPSLAPVLSTYAAHTLTSPDDRVLASARCLEIVADDNVPDRADATVSLAIGQHALGHLDETVAACHRAAPLIAHLDEEAAARHLTVVLALSQGVAGQEAHSAVLEEFSTARRALGDPTGGRSVLLRSLRTAGEEMGKHDIPLRVSGQMRTVVEQAMGRAEVADSLVTQLLLLLTSLSGGDVAAAHEHADAIRPRRQELSLAHQATFGLFECHLVGSEGRMGLLRELVEEHAWVVAEHGSPHERESMALLVASVARVGVTNSERATFVAQNFGQDRADEVVSPPPHDSTAQERAGLAALQQIQASARTASVHELRQSLSGLESRTDQLHAPATWIQTTLLLGRVEVVCAQDPSIAPSQRVAALSNGLQRLIALPADIAVLQQEAFVYFPAPHLRRMAAMQLAVAYFAAGRHREGIARAQQLRADLQGHQDLAYVRSCLSLETAGLLSLAGQNRAALAWSVDAILALREFRLALPTATERADRAGVHALLASTAVEYAIDAGSKRLLAEVLELIRAQLTPQAFTRDKVVHATPDEITTMFAQESAAVGPAGMPKHPDVQLALPPWVQLPGAPDTLRELMVNHGLADALPAIAVELAIRR